MSHHYTIDTRSSRILSYGFFLVALLGVTQTCWAEQNEPSVATISEDAPLPEKTLPTPNPLGSKGDIEIRALTFKGVEAGVTTVEQLKEAWGSPKSTVHDHGLTVHIYGIEPFRTVEVNVSEERVLSLVIYLENPMLDTRLASQLDLEDLRTVSILDENEEVLGVSFPERGVTFGFHSEAKKNMVAHMYLEPLSAEPFVLRAMADKDHQYEFVLHDLDIATRLEPDYADAFHAKAKMLSVTGQFVEALQAADTAVDLDDENLAYRLTRARVFMALGQIHEAEQDIQLVLETNRIASDIRATSLQLAGDLILNSSHPDYQEAMSLHQRAIDTATPLVSDNRYEVRRQMKTILVHSHLAIAKEVAFGDWQNKKQVIPKWLDRAAAIAEEFISHDQGDPMLRLIVSQEALAALTGIRHEVNPEQIANASIRRAEELEEIATDELFQHQVSWTLGKSLLDVLRIEHARGQAESAKKFGSQAVKLLESSAASRAETPEHSLLLGEAYFRLGSVYAVLLNDHETAITWYEKAAPLLEKPRPVIRPYQEGQMGEWFVSIGVSFWETRDRSRAIDVTQFGVRLLEEAVESETVPRNSLEIPYSNLAHMYQQIGDDERAKEFNELMAKVVAGQEESTSQR
ncbi:MAG: hypothetical protein MK179_00165 [Pirellulaceae bacterium]|nr:hypothetical protein [Pirellulaceae bacterium]